MLKKISDLFYFYDPTRENTYRAFFLTASMCLGALFWIYTHRPCSSIIVLVPQFLLMVSYSSEKNKVKIIRLIVYSLIFAFAAFAMSVLQEHKFMIIAVLFIITYIIYSSESLFYLTASVFILGVFTSLPGGWYEGVNRIFEMGISFIICFILLLIYEIFALRNIMYSTLKYTTGLVNDLFSIYIAEGDKKRYSEEIKNKYLLTEENIARMDIDIERIFSSSKDQFYHRVFLIFTKLDSLIYNQDFLLGKNKLYAKTISEIYLCYRRISRDLEFLEGYSDMLGNIKINLPETIDVVKNIRERLDSLHKGVIDNDFTRKSLKNEELITEWVKKLNELVNSEKDKKIPKRELKVYFGIKNILYDLDKLRRKYQDIRFNKFLR